MGRPLTVGDPDRLGSYTLLSRLGTGGMGTVYLGRAETGRLVAIKAIRADLSDDDELRARFRSEVNRARQVPPSCTAAVLDADLDHQPPYLVVEYVDGKNLEDTVRDGGPLTPEAVHTVAAGIATALIAVHGAGVIHRDLKPANVLIARGGIKVIDFGIARPLEMTSQHTRTDQMVGTVAYMAPERFAENAGRTVTPAADIFAWGVVVAYAATGRTPYAADSAPATAIRIISGRPDLTGLTGRLHDLVKWALDPDPNRRPTARTLLDALLTAAPNRAPAPGAGPATGNAGPLPRAVEGGQRPGPFPPHGPGAPRSPQMVPAYAAPASSSPGVRGKRSRGLRPVAVLAVLVVLAVAGVVGLLAVRPKAQPTASPAQNATTQGQNTASPAQNAASQAPGATDEPAPTGESGGTRAAAYVPATPQGMLELASRLLPGAEFSHIRGQQGYVRAYANLGAGLSMVTISVSGSRSAGGRDRSGAPKVVVSALSDNCVQTRIVTATWADGDRVSLELPTCLMWDGTENPAAPPPMSVAAAREFVADPRWGRLLDADLVSAGKRNFPSVS